METVGFVLPAIATLALGAALLVPLRDGRQGRRASLAEGAPPLRREFPALLPRENAAASASAGEPGDTPAAAAASLVLADREEAAAVAGSAPLDDAPALAREDGQTVALLENVTTAKTPFAIRIAACIESLRRVPYLIAKGVPAEPVDRVERSFAEVLEAVREQTATSPAEQPEQTAQATPARADFVVSARPVPERAVPLTRVPLRPQRDACTWPNLAGITAECDSPPQRHALLRRLRSEPVPEFSEALAQACREEDQPGRLLALRALMRYDSDSAKRAFVEALHSGTDDERALAVEGLAAVGAHADIVPALSDRVDAVAARAALAFVGTHRRADYRNALAPHLDASRIETILALLAGLVE